MAPFSGAELLGSFLALLAWREMPAVSCLAFRNCVSLYLRTNSLNCVNRGIQKLAHAVSDIPSNTTVLNISGNMISDLPKRGLENLVFLEYLRLDRNNLSRIAPQAFWKLHSLRELNLSHNFLESLQQDAFISLSNLTSLSLQHNKLGHLSGAAVFPLKRLQILDISFNDFRNASSVIAALRRVHALRTLYLQSCRIRYLEISTSFPPQLSSLLLADNPLSRFWAPADFFAGINYLNMSNCSLSRAENLTSINLSGVHSLSIGANPLEPAEVIETVRNINAPLRNITLSYLKLKNTDTLRVLCGIFQKRGIRSVNLEGNRFREVKGAFSRCNSILFLDMSHNRIKTPHMFTCGGAPNDLQTLILDHNLIRDVSLCAVGPDGRQCSSTTPCLGKLRYLSLRYNRISAIGSHAFRQVPDLETLTLALNEINFINTSAFAGLSKLKFLSLTNNAIGEIFPKTYMHLGNLEHLKLRNNRIPIIYNRYYSNLSKLITLDLGGNHIEKIEDGGFEGLRSLLRLYLDGNWLSDLSKDMFKDLRSLQVLDLAQNKLTFAKAPDHSSPFDALRNLRMLKLQRQYTSESMSLPGNLFDGLQRLQILDISNNNFMTLDTLPFHQLGRLQVLRMNDIHLDFGTMHNKTFANLVNLRLLSLERAGLESIRQALFENLASLTTLLLGSNGIRVVGKNDILQLGNLSYLDLQKNRLGCVCENLWFLWWAVKSKVEVPLFYNYSCEGQGGKKPLAQFDRLICNDGFEAFCLSALTIFAFVVTTLLYHKGKWNFYYSYYLLRAWIREKQLRRSHTRGHQYDAFVSYNSNDEDWVFDQLMPHLETEGPPFHRLCFHHRDFAVGKPIVENIVDAIYNSKKTLCVISKSYLQSEWCSMEMQVALYRLFDEYSDVLILVFLDEIPGHVWSPYHHLRKLLWKKTYISWPTDDAGQRLFWAKLRDALKADCSTSRKPAYSLIQHKSLLY
ncbi:toll-like receptor 13 [Mobula hypostoma]|uniref:toll-like receptor 13 n=1 Tax=Mobula hypostoma TaxID=723540 RepID=UPI002FC2DB56